MKNVEDKVEKLILDLADDPQTKADAERLEAFTHLLNVYTMLIGR
ncbi:hypothetical protein ACRYI5_00925 [Furfurilactobacillus sp. WILCCON 0119]